MAKRSKRRSSRHDRDHAGCISGLINVFHFRSTKRYLTDRKQVTKQDEGTGYSSNDNTVSQSSIEKSKTLVDTEVSNIHMADASKTSVKDLMEEEMFNEQVQRQLNDSEMGSEQVKSKSGNHTKNNQKKKSSSKSTDMDFDRVHGQKLSSNFDLEKVLQELTDIDRRHMNFLNFDVDIDVPSSEAIAVVEEKLVQAVKLFMEQRSSDSKHFGDEGNSFCSHELMDALKFLSLNKGLFFKLLEDPNSELVKHIQNVEDTCLRKKDKPKPDELSSHKHRNFFRRRTKSLESFSLGVNNSKDCQSQDKIVILKPGPPTPRSPETEIADNEKITNASQFSFTEIKRKLRHAMGKERRGVSPERPSPKLSPKPSNGNYSEKSESFGWRSPNRNHFYMEKFTLSSPSFKKGEPACKLKDEGSESLRLGGSNIYTEAKKHLSEIVKGEDQNTESVSGNNSVKSLGRILSLPEYNVSPCLSPKKHDDEIFITAQTRLSPRGTVRNGQSSTVQNLECQQRVSCSNSDDKGQSMLVNVNNSVGDDQDYSLEIQCFNEDTIVSEVQPEIERKTELRAQEEEKAIDISCEPSPNSVGKYQSGDTREEDNEESGSPCFKSHLSADDQVLSPPTGSPSPDRASTEIDDSDRAINKIEQPSPVSVLEPLFTDSDISTISHSEKEIQPRHIIFEEVQTSVHEQGICTRISLEDEESAFEYVEAVLLGSGLNWDEFLLRWISSYEILDSSLFDEVELFSSRPHHDQKLLFDCSNEALEEVCECCFGCFNGIPSAKPNVRPVPKGMDLINDVWKRVEQWLFQNSLSLPLDGLVKRDLSGLKWMNVQPEIEFIAYELEEMVFDELVEEILLVSKDCAFECEF
ncbi:hypothetical protein STAS_22163 [Striga asiatica]|uniref:PhosphatidylinositolN-acetyglucosaminlytransferase subunit P-related n=1 Tax=Striga asiatica TaxID=4170 RepID=A0A5A7QJM0_STRAF|nr:hypothetical protein STAS_22163 [Striga asiatica]